MKNFIVFILTALLAMPAKAGHSPKTDDEVYNEGVELMLDLKFRKAEKKFRDALELNEAFGEAHNNLAYCLRKQGEEFYEEALRHYNRAIALIPESPQPYMYRGVLFVSMGNENAAIKDHARLEELGSMELASELQWVIENRREKEPEQFFGVFREL